MEHCSFADCEHPIFVKETSHGPLCNGHYAQYRRKKILKPLRDYQYNNSDKSNHDTCPYSNCGRPSWHRHGYCQTHQRQLWAANGDESQLKAIRKHNAQSGLICKESECNNQAKSRGYCSKHYRKDWGNCVLAGCENKIHNKKTGFCSSHYSRYRKIKSDSNVQEVEVADVTT